MDLVTSRQDPSLFAVGSHSLLGCLMRVQEMPESPDGVLLRTLGVPNQLRHKECMDLYNWDATRGSSLRPSCIQYR